MDNVGSSLRGRTLESGFCQFEGFFYMSTGVASSITLKECLVIVLNDSFEMNFNLM